MTATKVEPVNDEISYSLLLSLVRSLVGGDLGAGGGLCAAETSLVFLRLVVLRLRELWRDQLCLLAKVARRGAQVLALLAVVGRAFFVAHVLVERTLRFLIAHLQSGSVSKEGLAKHGLEAIGPSAVSQKQVF
jgi:hypothetical protein